MQRSLFDDADEWMLSVEGFLASRCRVRAEVKDWERNNRQPIGAACGTRCFGLCEKCDPVGWSLRTSVVSACEALTTCSMAWNGKATPSGRWWWVLGQSERRIEGTEFGSWPTLHGTQGNNGPSGCELGNAVNNWTTPKDETRRGVCPSEFVGQHDQANPSTNGSDHDWPTPRTGRLDGGSNSRKTAANKGILKEATTRSLNAEWVAQLMGYPSDWLDLPTETLSALWETRSSPKLSS